MPDGGTLTISTDNMVLDAQGRVADLPAGEYVVVNVSDTGTGMTDEVLRNAFEPFFTTKPPGHGSGLGLSQVYGVARQSGGGVQIDSSAGKGTTVSALFPRAVGDVADEPRIEPATPGEYRSAPIVPTNRTILVVDDEAECRETIAAMLSANGFSVVIAEDGSEALRKIDHGVAFDLLLVDYAMPGMNGIELAEAVRARRPTVPAVFVTGGDGDRISEERWVLMKPFLSRTLAETLRAALGLAGNAASVQQRTSQVT